MNSLSNAFPYNVKSFFSKFKKSYLKNLFDDIVKFLKSPSTNEFHKLINTEIVLKLKNCCKIEKLMWFKTGNLKKNRYYLLPLYL